MWQTNTMELLNIGSFLYLRQDSRENIDSTIFTFMQVLESSIIVLRFFLVIKYAFTMNYWSSFNYCTHKLTGLYALCASWRALVRSFHLFLTDHTTTATNITKAMERYITNKKWLPLDVSSDCIPVSYCLELELSLRPMIVKSDIFILLAIYWFIA